MIEKCTEGEGKGEGGGEEAANAKCEDDSCRRRRRLPLASLLSSLKRESNECSKEEGLPPAAFCISVFAQSLGARTAVLLLNHFQVLSFRDSFVITYFKVVRTLKAMASFCFLTKAL